MGGFNPRQLQELMSQAKQQYESLQRKMQETVVDFSAGGGSVAVKMNGQKPPLNVTTDAEIVKSYDIEMLEDLLTAAVNGPVQKIVTTIQSSLGGMLGGLRGKF